jgi:hypothetical protein
LNILNQQSTDTIVINVTGKANISQFNVQLNTQYKDRILWNFGNVQVLSNQNGSQIEGSVLAPYASVTQAQNIEGNLIADDWTTVNSPEMHFGGGPNSNQQFGFDGSLPSMNAPAVPEGSSLALILSGLLPLGGMALRRKCTEKRAA